MFCDTGRGDGGESAWAMQRHQVSQEACFGARKLRQPRSLGTGMREAALHSGFDLGGRRGRWSELGGRAPGSRSRQLMRQRSEGGRAEAKGRGRNRGSAGQLDGAEVCRSGAAAPAAEERGVALLLEGRMGGRANHDEQKDALLSHIYAHKSSHSHIHAHTINPPVGAQAATQPAMAITRAPPSTPVDCY